MKILVSNWKLSELALMPCFSSKVLCCSENYNSECWKGDCVECMNGKNTLFPDNLDNVTNKEWSQNDHKHLALYTNECHVGGLKKKLLEGFNIYQKHV